MSNESKVMNQCFNGKHNICFSFKGRRDDQRGRKSQRIVLHNCIQTLLSDPIVVLYTDDNYICTGSLTGKVCLFRITRKENKGVNTDVSLLEAKPKRGDSEKNDSTELSSKSASDTPQRNSLEDSCRDNQNGIENDRSDSIGVGTSAMSNPAVGFSRKSSNGSIEVLEKYHILCMFRNNSIKSIYIDKNYAYVYYESCIDVFCIRTYQFVKKMNVEVANNKQVIYFENLILFNNSKSLFIYDIKNNCTSYFYKNFLKNIVIFDFNVNYLLCYKNNFGKCHIRVLQININAQKCEHELIFCVDFSSKFISHGKFLDDEKIIVAKNGRRLIIFDFKKAVDMYRIKKLKKKILDIYKSVENLLFILVENEIFIFNLSTFIFYKCVQLPAGLFYFKWSYFIRHKNNKIIFSSDRGIYFIDYPVEEGA
ncbi:hypothetical protein PVIIG_01779 [Plasmodium vivax India VII]|uniref:WD domain, G-beta repeat domain-containing protein n=1 Tax=Plasmodium vivax India VII TaxID=1077284 RepID=A0A0J9S9C4_PLAVI|nr:hypothetical protein PVIIG_01779 [Plasmodium vivax India VII]